jgi:hypothetical protein
MRGFDEWYPDVNILSDCCGVSFNQDIGLCPHCGDHCEGGAFDEDGNEIKNPNI